jgi:MoxR-like ATPase
VKFSQFVQLIAIGLQARIPMHMTGFPGVGKTEFTKSLETGFARAGVKCKVFILVGSIREPQDFGGFPVSTPDGVRLLPMAWARDAKLLAEDGHMVVIFLDELTTVPPTTQAAMLRLLSENVCGELQLPHYEPDKAALCTCAPATPSNGRRADRRSSRRWQTGCGMASSPWTTKPGAR